MRFSGKILSAAISRTADRWYVSIQVELPDTEITTTSENQAVGVDLGVKALATLSDGTVIAGVKTGNQNEWKLRRLNQELSRRQGARRGEEKSNNFKKTKRKISRLYSKMANIRSNETHQLTTRLMREYGLIGIEDLDVQGMMGERRLARSVADMSFFEFRRQLEYKAAVSGVRVVVADRWYASSKICSACGNKYHELDLNEREWTCSKCGVHHDREVNAAQNLRNYAMRTV